MTREGNRFDIYDKNRIFIKSIEKLIGFDCEKVDFDSKRYNITEISSTNLLL